MIFSGHKNQPYITFYSQNNSCFGSDGVLESYTVAGLQTPLVYSSAVQLYHLFISLVVSEGCDQIKKLFISAEPRCSVLTEERGETLEHSSAVAVQND